MLKVKEKSKKKDLVLDENMDSHSDDVSVKPGKN